MRCIQPANLLRPMGYFVRVGGIYLSFPAASVECVIIHRAKLDAHTRAQIEYYRLLGAVIIYDVDDLLFAEDAREHLSNYHQELEVSKSIDQYRQCMKASDVVLVSTEYLAKRASEFCKDVRVVRNALSREYLGQCEKFLSAKAIEDSAEKPLVIGYLSGSAHHDNDFREITDQLIRVLEDRPLVQLLVVGFLSIDERLLKFGSRVRVREFVPYTRLPETLSRIDINLAPLVEGDPFAESRSELKFIEAGAMRVPTVASPTGTNQKAIEHGVNGFLASSDQWYESLIRLIDDHSLRTNVGEAARTRVLDHYTPDVMEGEWKSLVEDLYAECRESRSEGRAYAARAGLYLKLVILATRRRIYLMFRSWKASLKVLHA